MEMVNLKNLFESLKLKDKKAYDVVDLPGAIWSLNGAKNGSLVEFTRTLSVYHDSKRGYEILNINRFSPEQLIKLQA
ncbi:MAG: hypothetical protein HOM11_10160 [Methylococcales bacterium]|jgi:hypothetical protein|nr:hypothetical protein [Methylococcales bacterium]MBT7445085.1 hypothetical protein [Methylococcales bacterium]